MSIKKYYATADTTITNAYKEDLQTRGTGSNMGLSDSLEVFTIYNQVSYSASASTALTKSAISLLDIPGISMPCLFHK